MQKQQIRDSLDDNFKAFMEKKLQIVLWFSLLSPNYLSQKQEKEMVDASLLKQFEEARKYEQLSKSMERERKNVLMGELKSEAQKYQQVAIFQLIICF